MKPAGVKHAPEKGCRLRLGALAERGRGTSLGASHRDRERDKRLPARLFGGP